MTAADGRPRSGWHRHDGELLAVFATGDHADGAQLGRAIAGADPSADVDIRASRTTVRLRGADGGTTARAARIDALASAAGLRSAPEAVRVLSVVVETAMPEEVAAWWSAILGYRPSGGLLRDPLRRRPSMLLRTSEDTDGARSCLHLDASGPDAPSAEDAPTWGGRFLNGPHGVRAADPEGNVADIIPAGPCWEDRSVSAWRGGFAAQAAWLAASTEDAAGFAEEAAAAADAAALALAIDRRGERVVVDSGKDAWETEPGFVELAAEVQGRAKRAQLVEEPAGLGFVQAFLSIEDVERTRAFWSRTLGYREDPRDGVLDLLDPHGSGPVLAFQQVDEPPERGAQDLFHLRLALPARTVAQLVGSAEAEHGDARRLDDATWRITDPEGNALEVVVLAEADPPSR